MLLPLNLLIIEDSEDDALLTVRELRRGGFEVSFERVENAHGMQTALAKRAWDIVISDYSMPRFTAVEALELLRSTGFDIPFLIISGSIGEDLAVTAMKGVYGMILFYRRHKAIDG